MKTMMTLEKYIVVPPKQDKLSLQDNLITIEDIADTEEGAWHNFLYPSLNKSGYQKDGYKAVPIKIKIEMY